MNTFKDTHNLICTHALDGTIRSANAIAARALGVKQHALVGRKLQDFLSPAGCAGFADYVALVVRDGVAEGTMVVHAADGTLRTWEYRNTLHRRGTGDPVIDGRAADVTDRETILRALRESEEQFRTIIENVSDMITIIDPEGRVRYASPSVESVLGYTPHELQGRSIFDFIHPGDAKRMADFFGTLDAAEAIEVRFCHAGGSLRFVEVAARKVMKGNHVTSIIATARDITERRTAWPASGVSPRRWPTNSTTF
jgi:PAS domain S-box-containing protein